MSRRQFRRYAPDEIQGLWLGKLLNINAIEYILPGYWNQEIQQQVFLIPCHCLYPRSNPFHYTLDNVITSSDFVF